MPDRSPADLVIAFLDLSEYTQDARRTGDDAALAERMQAYYVRVAAPIRAAGGTLVKFIGDGALCVFPTERADAALDALQSLKRDVDAWSAAQGWASHLVVKAHAGAVIAGTYGPPDDARYDVIGDAVNVTARLATRSFAISPQLFRLLAPASRQRLKKHTPPICYIPVDDRRP